jgi:hypothetical protein
MKNLQDRRDRDYLLRKKIQTHHQVIHDLTFARRA